MQLRDKLSYGYSKLSELGLTREQVAGALGSLMGESGRNLNTGAFNKNDPNGGSFGIGQWNSERRTALESFAKQAGKPVTDFTVQMDFVAHELQTTEKKALDKLKNAKTVAAANKTWTNYYERPNKAMANHADRLKHANYTYEELASIDPQAAQAGGFGGFFGGAVNSIGNVFGGIDAAVTGVADSISGAVTGKDTAGNPSQGFLSGTPLSGFFGDANTGAKLGAVAGGLFAGAPGAIVGGLLGQGIGMMLQGAAQAHAKSQFPDAPKGSTAGTRAGTDPRKSDAYRDSKQARDAIDSGKGGLW